MQLLDDAGDVEKVLERRHRCDEIRMKPHEHGSVVTLAHTSKSSEDTAVVFQAAGIQPARNPIRRERGVVTRAIDEIDTYNTVPGALQQGVIADGGRPFARSRIVTGREKIHLAVEIATTPGGKLSLVRGASAACQIEQKPGVLGHVAGPQDAHVWRVTPSLRRQPRFRRRASRSSA
jgi:hypothetical protein